MRVMLPCPRPGSDEPVNSVVRTSGLDDPGGPCGEDCNIYESDVTLWRTGLDQTVNNVVSTVDPGGSWPDHQSIFISNCIYYIVT